MSSPFDLVLKFPQWQGSGRPANLPLGARATAEVFKPYAPSFKVALSDMPGDGEGVVNWPALFDQFVAANSLLQREKPRRVLTAGGDCAIDIAPINYLSGLYPDLRLIWVDAHLDANTAETSPSGSFHGMPVACLMGQAPEPMRASLGQPMTPDRFRYYGTRAGDPGELAFRRDRGLRSLEPDEAIEGPIHIHFDLDALDPEEFPFVSYREPGGLSVAEAVGLIERVRSTGDLVGFTITEFAPANEEEAREGAKTIIRLCEAAIGK